MSTDSKPTSVLCTSFGWEDVDETDRSRSDFEVGDLVWDPKAAAHGAHILVGFSEPIQFGYEKPWRYLVCECGDLDMLDHHPFMAKKGAASGL